jgi:molybdate transport system permease protein
MALTQQTRPLSSVPINKRQGTRLLLAVLALPMLLFVLLPLVSLLMRTQPEVLRTYLADGNVVQAVFLSMATSTISTLLAVLVGTPLGYVLGRSSFRGRTLVETVMELPMVLPPAVAGVALLMAFGRRGVIGAHLHTMGLDLAFSQTAVVLAQLFVAAPFYVKSAVSAFSRIERDIEDAAALDGAGPLRVFRHMTLPLAWPVLFGGAVMTWARSLGEFGATIIFAGNFPGRTQTMPLAIYVGFELELGVALTLAVILLTVSFGVLLVVKGVLRQRIGAV